MPATKNKTGKKLVIVESPAKSKSIAKYLGDGFVVDASVGHIRDLPQPKELPAELKKTSVGKFAVDVDHGFEPYYVVYPDKKKRVTDLKRELKDADALYLATDADREGEAISWHLLEVLKPKVPVYRMTFTEITKESVQRALENLRDLDMDLVDAQETRRILDRLYGYEISPVLWRKVGPGLSAGRVQSVATRLVVERERERMAFVPAEYWDVSGEFVAGTGEAFRARLTQVDGRRVASGRDFNDEGQLRPAAAKADVLVLKEADASSLAEGLAGATCSVVSVEEKPYTRRPFAPFTTSTLQQDASRRLRFSSRVTMQVAQRLYENGFITYMRTDSVSLSSEAVSAARRQITELYGADHVAPKPRVYSSKNAAAQEAHEAIRPAGDSFRTPAQVKGVLSPDEFRLYELIWKRTVASQMADAKGSTATVKVQGKAADGRVAEFSASGTVITFQGFLAAYEEGKSEEAKEKGQQVRLPKLAEGDSLTSQDVEAAGHKTTPPARYTEASIVAELEKREIGRPSTYAPTISTIMDRGYVTKRGGALVPSWTAFSVIRLLEEHFGQYVDYDFTARLEDDLDRIAAGQLKNEDWLSSFYFGDTADAGLKSVVDHLGEIDARAINSIKITDDITLRVGKFGPYLEKSLPDDAEPGKEPLRANVPEDLAPDELTPQKAQELMDAAVEGDRELGRHPETGHMIVAKDGRYGPYVTEVIPEMTEEELQAYYDSIPTEYYKNGNPKPKKKPAKKKPKTASLFKGMSPATVTFEEAVKLMSLPRHVGTDSDGAEIVAANGRFGPYLKKGTDYRSLQSEEEIFTVTEEKAREIYAQPKQRGRGAAKPPLAEFGEDPNSGGKIVVKSGRFGDYITDGKTNVTIPRSTTVEQLTKEQAVDLLMEKRAKVAAKGGTATKKTAAKKGAAAKKPAARKSTAAKKTTATKATATKRTSTAKKKSE
ncbi:type I DNA topoisomerase [Pseudoglutamicibacter albus]|uniref:type I DNA topoisomerase n=1 Tax=Pseudoglutamicibacter albus TaxID=98671 RepID=UPI001EF645AE|nr:type I DNA topoisomerase [Pseudoglutamicibacter albus]